MTEEERIQEDETPTMKKLRALVRQVSTRDIAYETVIPQAILTLLIVGAAVWLAVNSQPLPEWLALAAGSIIGFYFGSDYEFRKMTGKAARHGNK